MDKVYLLLRNNHETGPYSLEEILQAGLKPDDLIWVEGQSRSWCNPSQIESLKAHIPSTEKEIPKPAETPVPSSAHSSKPAIPENKAPAAKHVYVSLPANFIKKTVPAPEPSPADGLEQKAEALRKRAQAYAAAPQPAEGDNTDTETFYPNTLNSLEQDYATWKQSQKRKKKRRFYKKIAVATLALLLAGAGYVLAKQRIGTKKTIEKLPTAQAVVKSQQENSPALKQPYIVSQDITPAENYFPDSSEMVQNLTASKPLPTKKKQISDPQPIEVKIDVPTVAHADNAVSPSPSTTVTKPDEKKDGEIKNAVLEEKTGSTSAPKEQTANSSPVRLADFVDLSYTSSLNSANNAQELKFVLKNRSTEVIKDAAVEVRYYNARNKLIQKKTINFTDVPPQQSAALIVPGNTATDHTYYYLLYAVN